MRQSEDEAVGLLGEAEAMALLRRMQVRAARIAEETCRFLLEVAEFDAREGARFFEGIKSVAHWLAFTCSMSPGTAREHVRVARALSSMPRVVELFAAGCLSYSKVREITRLQGIVEEGELCRLAQYMTAAQLARTVSAYRCAPGTRVAAEDKRRLSWVRRDDGLVTLSVTLCAEEAAEVITAIETARAHERDPADDSAETPKDDAAQVPTGTKEWVPADPVDALLQVARGYLEAGPADRSGEDHHLVMVHVDADQLTTTGGVPAGTCHHPEVGSLEVATAQRLACTGRVAGVIRDRTGEVLQLGRAKRLASRAQKRALLIRDRVCQFPSWHQQRHLEAHHLVPWAAGGATDLDNLVLICRRHHVLVHEGRMRIRRAPDHDAPARTSTTGAADAAVDGTTPDQAPAAETDQAPAAEVVRSTRALRHGLPRFVVYTHTGERVDESWWPTFEWRESLRDTTTPGTTTPGTTTPGTTTPDTTSPGIIAPVTATAPEAETADAGAPAADRIATIDGGYQFNLAACVEVLFAAELTTDFDTAA